MSAHRRLQALVLAANRWPVLKHCLRIPYHLAAEVLRNRICRFNQVSALYARSSFAEGRWTPGSSDIDLTVVLRSGLTEQTEFAAAASIHSTVSAIRRWFPMVGEAELINADWLPAYASSSWRAGEVLRWKLMGGAPINPAASGHAPDGTGQGLRVYRYDVSAKFPAGSPVVRRRLVAKVMRMFGGQAASIPDDASGSEMLAWLITELDRALDPEPECPFDATNLTSPARTPSTRYREVPQGLRSAWDSFEGGIWLPWSEQAPFLVLKHDLSLEMTASAIEAAWAVFDQPVLVTSRMLAEYFRRSDPFGLISLYRNRVLLGEHDPLPPPRFPDQNSIRDALCLQAAELYPDVYRPEIGQWPEQAFHNYLYAWVLRALRFLEEGIVDLDYQSLAEYMQRTGRAVQPAATAFERFCLLRRCAGFVAQATVRSTDQTM